MTDIETRVAESLRADADRVPASLGLAGRAMARAVVIRRRRRVAGATAATALAVAGALALPSLLPGVPSVPAPPVATASRAVLATTLPGSTDLPAADDPALVGSDPDVLHFDVDHAALEAEITTWVSAPGVESFVAESSAGQPRAEVHLSASAKQADRARLAPLTVGAVDGPDVPQDLKPGRTEQVDVTGLPATLERQTTSTDVDAIWVLRWQHEPGLFAVAQFWGDDRAAVLAVPAAIRLDRSQRCVTPLRLGVVPDGFRQTTCRTSIRTVRDRGWVSSQVVGTGGFSVWAEAAQPTSFQPNTTVGENPAQWRTEDPRGLWVANNDGAQLMIEGVTEAEARQVAVGLTLAPDLTRPSTWP